MGGANNDLISTPLRALGIATMAYVLVVVIAVVTAAAVVKLTSPREVSAQGDLRCYQVWDQPGRYLGIFCVRPIDIPREAI